MRDKRATIELNQHQKAYYESRFEAGGGEERAANWITNLWTRLRRRIQQHDDRVGTKDAILADHRNWLGDVSQARVLDLGCFSGNELSLWLAERATEYTGIDLSEHATAKLQAQLDEQVGGSRARAVADDILRGNLPAEHYDIVYAYSVLHHFQDIEQVLAELDRVLKPGGVVVSIDPMATEPLNRTVRALYRPFQSDRAWEWPFTRATFGTIRRHFRLDRLQGYRGASMLSLPLALLPFMEGPARRLGQRGLAFERRRATAPGWPLWLCWMVGTRLVKPGAAGATDNSEAS